MFLEEIKKEIITFVEKASTKKAIDSLLKYFAYLKENYNFKSNQEEENAIRLLSSRYNSNEKKRNNGTLSSDEYNAEIQKINNNILEFIGELEPVESQNGRFNSVKQINTIPKYNHKEIVNRIDEIEKLDNLITKYKIIVLYGSAGIGKRSVLHKCIEKFNYSSKYYHKLYIKLESSLEKSLDKSFYEKVKKDFEKISIHISEDELIISALNQLGKNNLMIIEVSNSDEKIVDLFNITKDLDWNIIFITNYKATPQLEGIPIGKLSDIHTEELFTNYYSKHFDRNVFLKIIESLDFNTFLIELFANYAENDPTIETLEDLYTIISKYKILKISDSIQIKDSLGNFKYVELGSFLHEIFPVKELNDNERHYLLIFIHLPTQPVKFIHLQQLANIEKSNIQDFKKVLRELTNKGWLINEGSTYNCPLIKRKLFEEQIEDNYGGLYIIINSLLTIFKENSDISNSSQFIEYAVFIAQNREVENSEVAELNYFLSNHFYQKEDYNNSNIFIDNAIEISQNTNDIYELQKCYTFKSNIYLKINDIENSELFRAYAESLIEQQNDF